MKPYIFIKKNKMNNSDNLANAEKMKIFLLSMSIMLYTTVIFSVVVPSCCYTATPAATFDKKIF